MNYPVCHIKTPDNITLYGLLLESKNSKTIFLNIHGTSSNFYEEEFIKVFSEIFLKENVSLLSANNRGAGVYDAHEKTGAATEKFEDCVIDIDSWIDYLVGLGYENVILSGHSLGTEKCVYYMNKGKNVSFVKSLVLLAPSDSRGYELLTIKNKKWDTYEQAKQFMGNDKGEEFISRVAYSGIMPKTANSLDNFLNESSELRKALPFSEGRLKEYSKIKIPILAVIGDQVEYTVIPIKEALDMMKRENKLTTPIQINNCNHDFEGHEEDLAKIVLDHIKKSLLPVNNN